MPRDAARELVLLLARVLELSEAAHCGARARGARASPCLGHPSAREAEQSGKGQREPMKIAETLSA